MKDMEKIAAKGKIRHLIETVTGNKKKRMKAVTNKSMANYLKGNSTQMDKMTLRDLAQDRVTQLKGVKEKGFYEPMTKKTLPITNEYKAEATKRISDLQNKTIPHLNNQIDKAQQKATVNRDRLEKWNGKLGRP